MTLCYVFMCFVYKLIFQLNAFVHGILGGHAIGIESAPYQVNYGDICGGVLIHKLWALTSAHCGTNEDFIRVGSEYRLRGRRVKIIGHIVHPKYGYKHMFDYDIQLLRIYKKLHFHRRVSAIKISTGAIDDNVLVAGWGYAKEKGDYLDKLHQVKLRFVPEYQCQEVDKPWYNHTLTRRMFCAGDWRKDACQGDSGGGAVSAGRLLGISSFGFGCGRNIPGVYIDLTEDNIRTWIFKHARV